MSTTIEPKEVKARTPRSAPVVPGTAFKRLVRAFEGRYRAYFPPGQEVTFVVRGPEGEEHRFGVGEPAFTLVANDVSAADALATLDVTAAAGAYLDGKVDLEGDILRLIQMRDFWTDRRPIRFAWRFIKPMLFGQVKSDKEWISEHYDFDDDFYLLWLDRRHRCYSQGIFAHDDESLEDAMTRKLDFALEAVGAKEGDRVLDIGGGWGAMLEHAGKRGIRITSLTISRASEAFINGLLQREKLPCQVLREHFFEHHPAEQYDAIVNLGVTEHLPDYAATLRHYDELLKPGGKVYLDASSTRRKSGHTTFLEKFVYPGNGSLMCLHEYLADVAASPFRLQGVWDDQHSYYLTSRHWAENLDRNRAEIERRWGKDLHRKFQLYLWGTADGFRVDRNQAYRVLLAK